MGASTSLVTSTVSVTPGGEARTRLRVRNNGAVVDRFVVEVVGPAQSFATAEPPDISLFPGAEGFVDIAFRPPRHSSIPAGVMPFAVRTLSYEDPAGSTVDEGTIDVARFDDRSAELRPKRSRGKRSAHHVLAIDNHGNGPVKLRFSGLDPEDDLHFKFSPQAVVSGPGTAEIVSIKVTPSRSFWTGASKTFPFTISVIEDGKAPTVVDGTMVQERKAPRWVLAAGFAAVVLGVGAAIAIPALRTRNAATVSTPVAPIAPVVSVVNATPTVPGGGGGQAPQPSAAGQQPQDTTAKPKPTNAPAKTTPPAKTTAPTTPPTRKPNGVPATFAPGSNESIVLAVNPWTSSIATTNVAAVVLQRYLGTDTALSSNSGDDTWQGLADGSIDAVLEVWPSSHAKDYDTFVRQKKSVVDLGKLGPTGKLGWYIPTALLAAHPELATINGFKTAAAAKLFATSQSGTQGQFVAGDESHVSYDQAIIDNLHLPFTIVNVGNEEQEVSEIQAAVANGEPLLFRFEQPQWVESQLQLTEVKLPAVTADCQAAAAADDHSAYDCDYPAEDLFKAATAGLKKKNPVAFRFLSKFQLTADQQNEIGTLIAGQGMQPQDAAEKWVDEHQDVVSVWLTS